MYRSSINVSAPVVIVIYYEQKRTDGLHTEHCSDVYQENSRGTRRGNVEMLQVLLNVFQCMRAGDCFIG